MSDCPACELAEMMKRGPVASGDVPHTCGRGGSHDFPAPSAEEGARGIVEQWLSAGCGCGFPPSQLDDAYGQGTHKADLVDAIATALTKRDALNIEALTTAHAEIARLAGEIAKRDADVAEWKRQCEAEGQVAYMERDRAEAAVAWAMCEERRRQAAEQSVTCWQADSAVWQARFSDAAARLETMRATVRDLLLSADALWEEHDAGHNWREACERARTALGVETENEERPSKP